MISQKVTAAKINRLTGRTPCFLLGEEMQASNTFMLTRIGDFAYPQNLPRQPSAWRLSGLSRAASTPRFCRLENRSPNEYAAGKAPLCLAGEERGYP